MMITNERSSRSCIRASEKHRNFLFFSFYVADKARFSSFSVVSLGGFIVVKAEVKQ